MMFCKLALRNVRRSFRDYGVYLLTLTFGVCLFYTFNAVENQGAMAYLHQVNNPMVGAITTLVDIFSVFVALVLACLILYADGFLLRRRKRELGTYLLLGLSQRQVARLLFLETGVIGLVSLAAGLGLGTLASLGLSALTLSMFQINPAGLGLAFSPEAACKTAAYFSLIFLLVMGASGFRVSRAKLLDLLQGARKNEVLRPQPLRRCTVQLVAGVLLLAAAYTVLLTFGMAVAVVMLPICIPMLAMGTLGTLLIFRSLSGFVMKLALDRPNFCFRGLNLFTLRQWLSKVHTTYLAQTVVCILLLLAIGITASSIGLNSTIQTATWYQAPFDITIHDQSGEVDQTPVDLDAVLAENGFDLSHLAWSYTAGLYYNDPEITGRGEPSAVIRLSDYDALRARAGEPAYAGPLPSRPMEDSLTTGGLGVGSYCIVSDETAQKLPLRRQIWSADYAGDKTAVEEELLQTLNSPGITFASWYTTKLSIYQDLMGNKLLALFLGLYLGFTFLLAAAAVLALQQLSQAADNAGRYAILRRLGAEDSMVARSATQQVALAFLLPLALALVHSVVGMKAANDLIATAGRLDSVSSSAVTALILAMVYGGYFLATALACRRLARQG